MPDFGGGPINYSAAVSNATPPAASLMSGVQAGIGMQYAGLQQAMQTYQFQRQQQMQQASAQVAQNPTPDNIAQLSIRFPEMSEQFKRSYDMVQPQQQRQDLNHMTEVHAAMVAGRPDIAGDLLDQRAQALQNSNAPQQQIDAATTAAKWARTDPNSFTAASGLMLAAVTGPEKYGETFNSQTNAEQTAAKTPYAVQQAAGEAGIATANAAAQPGLNQARTNELNTNASVAAGRLNLDRDALVTNTQTKLQELKLQYGTPDDQTASQISSAALDGSKSELLGARLNNVADQLDGVSRSTGWTGSAAEAMKRATGTQDGVTALKQLYANATSLQALGSIKDALGGRVTDVDMKVAMGNVPDENASPQVVSSYLRGMAKLNNLQAAMSNTQAEWLSQQGFRGNLGPARSDMTIEGTQVPKGTSFSDFSRSFIQQKANQISAQQAVVNAQGRGYMRFADPNGTAPPNGGSAFPQAVPPGPGGAVPPALPAQ